MLKVYDSLKLINLKCYNVRSHKQQQKFETQQQAM